MHHLKYGIEINAIVLLLTIAMLNPGVAVGAGLNRIYPTDKVTIYDGDKKVGVYTKEAPFPEGATISTSGRCAVKLGALFLVAEDQSVFSSNTSGRQRNLFIKDGNIYFKISKMRQPLTLITPNGEITVQSIRLDAALYDQSIKGYVAVTKGQSELGVVEGGSMDVLTDNGQVTIKSGSNLILSQAEMDIGAPPEGEKPAEEEPQKPKTGLTGTQIGYIALAALGGIGLIFALGGGGGGGVAGGDSLVHHRRKDKRGMINNKHGVVKVKNPDQIKKMKGYGASVLQKKMFRLFLMIFWLTLFGGCAVTNEPNNISYYMGSSEISELNEKILSQAQMSSEPGDILIGEGDLLQISVFEAKELDKTVRVNSRGFISLPLIGEVRVSGLTAIETEEKIEEMYETRFIKDPHVSIFVEEQISQRITLVGQFKKPGTYDYLSNQRLLDVIALGGGLSEQAGQIVQVRRTRYVQGEPNTFIVDLDRLIKEGNVELNIRLNGGDVLFIPEAGVFFVDGAVRRPGSYPIKHKTVVQEGLVEAGGFEPSAKKDRIKLLRMTEIGERKIIDIDLSKTDSKQMALKDRDILIVGESALGGLGRGFSITVLGTGFTYWGK